jgi:prepilin-type N-terminal cleavage/methylation domain-containing protein
MLTPRDARRGFTLVELLVVIAIIGILVGLLLPAVQSAREAGRRTQCANNLRNLGLASIQHLGKHKKLPSGGWGERWVGYPDGGVGDKQSGGWVYTLLPYLEQEALFDAGIGDLTSPYTQLKAANQLKVSRAMALMLCPSRGRVSGQLYPIGSGELPYLTNTVSSVGRGDYAANSGVRYSANGPVYGDQYGCEISDTQYPNEGQFDPKSSTATTFTAWPSTASSTMYRWTGVVYQRSGLGDGSVRDGMTYTYLYGEKFLPRSYEDGTYPGDNGTLFGGMGNDNFRSTYVEPASQSAMTPKSPANSTALKNDADDNSGASRCLFGGPHSGIVQFVFCDGAIKNISTSIDAHTHRYLGERADKQILDDGDFN